MAGKRGRPAMDPIQKALDAYKALTKGQQEIFNYVISYERRQANPAPRGSKNKAKEGEQAQAE